MKNKFKLFFVLFLTIFIGTLSINCEASNRHSIPVWPIELKEVEPNNDIQNAQELSASVPDIIAVSKHDISSWKRMHGTLTSEDIDVYKTFLLDRRNYLYLYGNNLINVEVLNSNGNILQQFQLNPSGRYACVELRGVSGECYIRLSGANSNSKYVLIVGQIVGYSHATFRQQNSI